MSDDRAGRPVVDRTSDPAAWVYPDGQRITAAGLERVIAAAIERHDLDVVPGLIKALAALDARRAAAVYDAITIGLDWAVTIREGGT